VKTSELEVASAMKSTIVIIVFVALFSTALGDASISSGEPFINIDNTNSSAKEYGPLRENVALDIVEPIGQPNEETVAPANSSETGSVREMRSGMTSDSKPLAIDTIRILFESMDGMTCDRKLKVVEDMVEKMLVLFDAKVTAFPSVEFLNETYCRKFPDWYKIALQFKPCLPSFTRTLFGVTMTNVKKVYKLFCQNPGQLRLAYEHVKCMDETTKGDFIEIYHKIVNVIVHVSKMENLDDIIPAACCGTKIALDQGMIDLARICNGKGRTDTPQFVMSLVSSVISDALDIMCAKWPTVSSCHIQRPDLVGGIVTAMTNYTKYDFSPVRPLLKIMERLDSKINV